MTMMYHKTYTSALQLPLMHRASYTMAFSQHIKDVYKTETAQQNQEETAGEYDENQRTTIFFFF